MPQYLLLNGDFKPVDQAVLSIENRGFRYGDTIFETIRFHQGSPCFFNDHYKRLLQGMVVLKMPVSQLPSQAKLAQQMQSLVTKNRLFKDVRIRLTVFREDGGFYTPLKDNVCYSIEASGLLSTDYEFNKRGLIIGVYDDIKKPISPLSAFKQGSASMLVLAGIFKSEQKWDDVLICNTSGKIIESLASNIFWIKDNQLFTPFVSSGCVDGIMRQQICKMAKNMRIPLHEVTGTTAQELLDADELFLTNAINGIQWVVGLQDKRYYNTLSKTISRQLNELLKNQVS
jgi:branched-chain amino acid aminotransferase